MNGLRKIITREDLNSECKQFSHSSYNKQHLGEWIRYLSYYIIDKFFSKDWIRQYFYKNMTFAKSDDLMDSLYIDIVKDPFLYLNTTKRLSMFAECLYNLQNAGNFESAILDFKQRTKHFSDESGFESVFGEILSARYLMIVGLPVSFMRTSKVRTYDIHSSLLNGHALACEVKTKINDNNFNIMSYLSSVITAIEQTANINDKFFFIKIPGLWSKHENFNSLIYSTFKKYLNHTRGIMTFHETYYDAHDNLKTDYLKAYCVMPYTAVQDNPLMEYILNPSIQKQDRTFVSLEEIILDLF